MGCATVSSGADAGLESTDSAVHSDAEHSFTLKFPSDFTVTADPKIIAQQSYFALASEPVRLGGFYSGRDFADTNFGGACIVVSASPAKEQENDCARYDGDLFCGPEQEVRDAEINGIGFKSAILADAAVGNRLEIREYWTIRNGCRYEIRLCLSYSDIGMYAPGEKQEFDRDKCWGKLTGILGSFRFSPYAD